MMAQFTSLPNELLLHVAGYVGSWRDLAHLATINRHTNDIVGLLILRYLTDLQFDTVFLAWLIEHENVHGVKKALRFGVSPSKDLSRACTSKPSADFLSRYHPGIPNTHVLTYRRAAGNRMSGLPACDFARALRLNSDMEDPDIFEAGKLPPKSLHAYAMIYRNSNFSLLHHAAKQGNTEIIQLLLDYGADVHSLCLDCQGGSVMAARTLLPKPTCDSQLPLISRRPRVQYTPLHSAILAFKTAAAMLLLDAGASPKSCRTVDAVSYSDWNVPTTALHLAAFLGNKELIKYLIEKGYQSVDEKDEFGLTPIIYASTAHTVAIVGDVLLHKGSDPNTLKAVLNEACWHRRFDDALVILDHGTSPELSGSCLTRHLLFCCVRKTEPLRMICSPMLYSSWDLPQESLRLQLVRRLICSGANPHERVDLLDLDETTPLSLALECGLVDIVKELIAYGVSIHSLDAPHRNALHAALQATNCDEQSKFETISYILDLDPGCDVNETNAYGQTALHVLGSLHDKENPRFTPRHEEILGERLLQKGADVHARADPYAPLAFPSFCRLGSYRFCRRLADLGAAYTLSSVELIVTFRNLVDSVAKAQDTSEAIPLLELLLEVDHTSAIMSDGDCFDMALSEGAVQIAQYLLENGCSYNPEHECRGHVLHRACQIGATGIVKALCNRGVEINGAHKELGSLLEIAISQAYGSHDVTTRHRGHELLVYLLCRRSILVPQKTATTLIKHAIERNDQEVLALALERWDPGADNTDWNSTQNQCFTFLFAACDSSERICSPEIIGILLRCLQRFGIVIPHTMTTSGSGLKYSPTKSFRTKDKSLLGWLISTYKSLDFCPMDDCSCGDNLHKSIVVLLSMGQLSSDQAYGSEVKQLIENSRVDLAHTLSVVMLDMTSRVSTTGLGGKGRSTRHCLEYIMEKLCLSSVDLKDPPKILEISS